MATINNLPMEILAQIFYFSLTPLAEDTHGTFNDADCLGEFFNSYTRRPAFNPYATRQKLAGTCSMWRDTVVRSPSLWTNIVLDNSALLDKGVMETVLTRSGNMLLDVKVMGMSFKTAGSRRWIDSGALAIFRQNFYRIRVLGVVMDAISHAAITPHLFPYPEVQHLASLEHFYGACTSGWALAPAWRVGTINAPKLMTFMVSSELKCLWELLTPPLMEGITRILVRFKQPPTLEELEAMSRCHNMDALSWWESMAVPRRLPTPIQFWHLRSFSLSLTKDAQFADINSIFYTPLLRHFTITGTVTTRFEWIAPFLKKNPQLEDLILRRIEAEHDATDVFLRLTKLTSLSFLGRHPGDRFISSLRVKTEDGKFILPNLRTVVLERTAIALRSSFVDLIRARLSDTTFRISGVNLYYPEKDTLLALWKYFPTAILLDDKDIQDQWLGANS